MILITTSRKPSARTRKFSRELAKSLGGIYRTRGKTSLFELIDDCIYNGYSGLFVVEEKQGNPSRIRMIKIENNGFTEEGYLLISLIKLRSDLKNYKNRFPTLKLDFKSKELLDLFLKFLSNEEGKYKMVERNKIITFYVGKVEVGPVFKIKGLRKHER